MSKRRVRIVLLCEDKQHSAFFLRYLDGIGYEKSWVDVRKASAGSGEQWVRNQYPVELRAYRSNPAESLKLLVVIDGDGQTLVNRLAQLRDGLLGVGLTDRTENEAVAILIPRRNIETWIHYLQGEKVDEDRDSSYPKLDRESDCKAAVDRLLEWRAADWNLPDDCRPPCERALTS